MQPRTGSASLWSLYCRCAGTGHAGELCSGLGSFSAHERWGTRWEGWGEMWLQTWEILARRSCLPRETLWELGRQNWQVHVPPSLSVLSIILITHFLKNTDHDRSPLTLPEFLTSRAQRGLLFMVEVIKSSACGFRLLLCRSFFLSFKWNNKDFKTSIFSR